ncbi:MAG: hypothetical protein Q9165_008346 [Trypethelium subeluteriae]
MDAPTIQPKFLPSRSELGLVAVGFSGGQCKPGVDAAPMALIDAGIVEQIKNDLKYNVTYDDKVHAYNELMPASDPDYRNMKKPLAVSAVTRALSAQVYEHASKGRFVLTLGGDHSIAIGSISGTAQAIRERLDREIAVIWVDAHADINTPETSDSGNIHGMPVAFLTRLATEEREDVFGWIKDNQTISTRKLVYIGLRDVDREEKRILKENGIKAFSMHDIDRHGIGKVMDMALGWIGSDTPIHLSFDIDALDPMWAPSTGTAVRGGLTLREGDFIADELDSRRDGRERVVVLGSGWAGYNAAQNLDPKKYQAVIVSPRSYFVFTPLLASTSVGTLEFRTALEPVRNRRSRLSFFQGWADSVDFNKREITVEEAVDDPHQGLTLTTDRHAGESPQEREKEKKIEIQKGQLFTVGYDKLIIAVGCYSQTFNTPGVKENALFLKDVGDARKIRKRLLACFETASLPTTTDEMKRQLLRFVVVGGGPTGIEFSAEMHDIIKEDLARIYPELMPFYSIAVYDVAPRVLSMFDEKLAKYAMSRFAREGIEIKTSHHVQEVRRGFPGPEKGNQSSRDPLTCFTLKVKEEGEIGVGMVVWSTGLMMNPFIEHAMSKVQSFPRMHMRYDKSQVNEVDHPQWLVRRDPKTGGIITDDHLKLILEPEGKGEEKPTGILDNVFALGDCATIEGTAYPATAQVASQKAEWLAARLNKGDLEAKPFRWKNLGVMAERDFKTLDETPQHSSSRETLADLPTNVPLRRGSSISSSRAKRPKQRVEEKTRQSSRPASPTWEDIDEDRPRRKSKSTPTQRANTSSRRIKTISSTQLGTVREESAGSGQDVLGFFPKLSRILENKESSSSKRRSSGSVTSGSERNLHSVRSNRSSSTEANDVAERRAIRHKHRSQQRRAELLTNPSMLSVVSGVTNSSGTSSGSGSTITQKSYDKSSSERRRRSGEHSRHSTRRCERSVSPSAIGSRTNSAMDRSNVFSFMVPDVPEENNVEPSHTSSSSSAYAGSDAGSSHTPATSVTSSSPSPSMHRTRLVRDGWNVHEKVRSDDTTSVRGSSSERSLRSRRGGQRRSNTRDGMDADRGSSGRSEHREAMDAPVTEDYQYEDRADYLRHQYDEALRHQRQQHQAAMQAYYQHAESLPRFPAQRSNDEYSGAAAEYYYPSASAPETPSNRSQQVMQYAHSIPEQQQARPHSIQSLTKSSEPDKTLLVGYEALAAKLSSNDQPESNRPLQPIYRKFEHLNHRILLYLQDEVAELEDELRRLDESIAQASAKAAGKEKSLPASRRAEAKAGTEAHHRRVELLGRIFMKIGQYNQAFSSYHSLLSSSSPASPPDIAAYETYLTTQKPLVDAESRFLHHRADLLTPLPRSSTRALRRHGSATTTTPAAAADTSSSSLDVRCAIWGLPLALAVPLLAFRVVGGLWGRLVVLVLVVAAGAGVVSRHYAQQGIGIGRGAHGEQEGGEALVEGLLREWGFGVAVYKENEGLIWA